jgi:hypothetical protein
MLLAWLGGGRVLRQDGVGQYRAREGDAADNGDGRSPHDSLLFEPITHQYGEPDVAEAVT